MKMFYLVFKIPVRVLKTLSTFVMYNFELGSERTKHCFDIGYSEDRSPCKSCLSIEADIK